MKEAKKLEFDYSKLRGRIREKFGTYERIDPYLSFTTITLSRKLNNKGYFGSDEIIELSKALEIEEEEMNEYFFNLIVRKDEQKQEI